jgi:hypothetical protein
LAGGANSTLGTTATEIAAKHDWKVQLGEASPNSDYWTFHTHGVPSIFIIPGSHWEGVTQQQHDALFKRWDHYHQPEDEWSEDFPFRGLQRYAQLALEIGRAVANAPARPTLLRRASQ